MSCQTNFDTCHYRPLTKHEVLMPKEKKCALYDVFLFVYFYAHTYGLLSSGFMLYDSCLRTQRSVGEVKISQKSFYVYPKKYSFMYIKKFDTISRLLFQLKTKIIKNKKYFNVECHKILFLSDETL